MRFVRTAIIATVASAAIAGAALAAGDDAKMMLVALPDGSVQHIRYQGDIAPQLIVLPTAQPVNLFDVAFGPGSPFAEMERISAAMDAHAAAMLRRAAAMQADVASPDREGLGIIMTNAQGEPVGAMRYSYVSTVTTADGCTQTISYSSDGATTRQPKVIKTSSGSCGTAAAPRPAIGPAAPQAKPAAPVKIMPTAKPAPKVTPVSAPRPLPEFTPSPTI